MADLENILEHMETMDDMLSQKSISSTTGTLQTRAIQSVNRAQDLMELMIADKKELFTEPKAITQTVNQEYTDLTSGIKRIDSVWFISSSTSRPTYEIYPQRRSGAHRETTRISLLDTSSTTTGEPSEYFWERRNNRLYWDRDPGETDTIRVWGFYAVTDLIAQGTFLYPDEFLVPCAALAIKFFNLRADESMAQIDAFGQQFFGPVLHMYSRAHQHRSGDLRGSYPNY